VKKVRVKVNSIELHWRGKVYHVRINGKVVKILVTFHCLKRMRKWDIKTNDLLETLLFPEEVLKGHFNRYIAHKRYYDHLIRIVYEYKEKIPVVVTVYFPYASRYYQGGKIYEDKILT